MFKSWKSKSLHVKASLLIVGVVASALFLADYIDRYYINELIQENMQSKTLTLLRQVEKRITSKTQLNNKAFIDQYLQELFDQTPDLLILRFYKIDQSGKDRATLVVSFGEGRELPGDQVDVAVPDLVNQTIKGSRSIGQSLDEERDHRLTLTVPVSIKGTMTGVLYAEFWTGQFDAVTTLYRQWSLVIRSGVGLLLIIVLNGFLYVQIIRPLTRLRSGIHAVARDDWQTVVPIERQDEIGDLGFHFNAMVRRIAQVMEDNKKLHQELQSARDILQDQVNLATVELVQRNEELAGLNERLTAAQRETLRQQRLAILGQLVATIAHKIGTPLTAISGHLQLLQEESGQTQGVRERIQTLLSQTERLSRIIQDLLMFAREPTLTLEPIQVDRLMEQTLNLFRPLFDRQKVAVSTEFTIDGMSVPGDSMQLQEVFGNLIDNAMDVMPDGGCLSVRISLANPEQNGDGVMIEIEDSGPGIPAAQQEKIFEPFFTTKRSHRGTGLGLAIVSEIIQLHGGTIAVRSVVGKGTCFGIQLPVATTRL